MAAARRKGHGLAGQGKDEFIQLPGVFKIKTDQLGAGFCHLANQTILVQLIDGIPYGSGGNLKAFLQLTVRELGAKGYGSCKDVLF